MAEIWFKDDPMPDTCPNCVAGLHEHHHEFFEHRDVEENIVYGPFSCMCPCTPENREYQVSSLLESLFDDPEAVQD